VAGNPPRAIRVRRLRLCGAGALAMLLLLGFARATANRDTRIAPASSDAPRALENMSSVWQVEETSRHEIYSNGLRIDAHRAVRTQPRLYRAVAHRSFQLSRPLSQPAGIIFHSTESPMAPFDAAYNARLKRNGSELLEFVTRNAAYHFLIDRFGRVFRVVAESDYANHAGASVWADDEWIYLNLNQSFLGVSFEAQTAGQSAPYTANRAQIQAARVLVEMLRSRYQIPAQNCATHAQVSVNPSSKAIGYHTDWGRSFPFREIGLPDGYRCPLPSVTTFGFGYDSVFLNAIGGRVWPGLLQSEEQVLRDAAANGLTPAAYRTRLRKRYREMSALVRTENAIEEKNEQGM
jgi:hypothetical protein